MRTTLFTFCRAVALVGVLFMVYACAVTTDATESSSRTVENSIEATSDVTSSTSPSGDSTTSSRDRALAFSKVKLERIKTDIAVGGGEHLTSLATLLGVPDHNQPEFFALTKANFNTLFNSEQTTAEELLAGLEGELGANPGLLE